MSWQLWVAVAVVASGFIVLLVIRLRQAQRVFDDLTRAEPALGDPDELARLRSRRHPSVPHAARRTR